MQSLPGLLALLWGSKRAAHVAAEYKKACENHSLFVRDLAIFCNAAAPVTGACEFERGVEEGKRRVWLHVARLSALNPSDFVSITDGELPND
ncbi:MAG: hypothetical protein ABL973_20815 [Micropepsaceae bacterium]